MFGTDWEWGLQSNYSERKLPPCPQYSEPCPPPPPPHNIQNIPTPTICNNRLGLHFGASKLSILAWRLDNQCCCQLIEDSMCLFAENATAKFGVFRNSVSYFLVCVDLKAQSKWECKRSLCTCRAIDRCFFGVYT